MAALPEVQTNTAQAILRGYEKAASEQHRMHLGGSVIGGPCDRRMWYGFRWADKETLSGQKLRLFQSGHLQEPRLIEDLRRIGVEVSDAMPDGKQWSFGAFGGHFGLSLDGAGLGFPEAPKTWHTLEFKTANQKSFDKIVKDGVEKAKPQHYGQMQVGMRSSGLDRAMYIVVNKNTDEIYSERVRHDPVVSARLMAKAESIIKAAEPPSRLSERADWFECKFCPFHAVCHGDQVPEVNCRTCAHSTPDIHGEGGKWVCANEKLASAPVISETLQRKGCAEHRYIPIFLARTAKPVDYHEGAVVYETKDGGMFANGDGTNGTFTSAEIRKCGCKATLPDMVQLKYEFKTAEVTG